LPRPEHPSQRALSASDWLIALAIFGLALIVRLLFLYSRADGTWPHSALYEGDAPEWIRWAQALRAGQLYEFGLPFRSPGVAHLLHWLGAGDPSIQSYAQYKALWCVMSALTCALAYAGFVSGVNRRAALIAAGLCIFSFSSIELATSLNNETPYALCVFGSVFLLNRLARAPSWWAVSILAIINGAAMLLRAEHPLMLAAFTGWLAWRWFRSVTPAVQGSRPAAIRIAMLTTIVAGAVVLCLPWSFSSAQAVKRYNTSAPDEPMFDRAPIAWTAEARAWIGYLPAFARGGNFLYITALSVQAGKSQVTAADVQEFFRTRFHYMPEPLPAWALLSIKGPLDFALANHPRSEGGFARYPLMEQGETNPALHLAQPDHLYLVNHGYFRGWQYIRSDPKAFGHNVVLKLRNFSDGIAMGFTSSNLPMSPYGLRRAIDITVPEGIGFTIWKTCVLAICAGGLVLALRRRMAMLWLLIIACKIVVTIVFYGYARQAASIYPCFALLLALPVNQIIERINAAVPLAAGIRWAIGGALVVMCVLIGVRDFSQQKGASIIGPVVPAPQWQPAGFECTEPVRIIPRIDH
jgi:hypothetical protein